MHTRSVELRKGWALRRFMSMTFGRTRPSSCSLCCENDHSAALHPHSNYPRPSKVPELRNYFLGAEPVNTAIKAIFIVAALHYSGAMHAGEPVDRNQDQGWLEFASDATAYLASRQDDAEREFDLESWERYSVDPETGTLTFSTGGKPGVVAHILVVGSIADKPGTWLWSWANSSMPKSLSEPITRVRQFGKDHGFDKLADPVWPGDKIDGWEMAAAAAFILSAKGAYRAPYEDGDGAVFLIFTDIHRVE
jgi:hypothetical protein